ncbi:MAG: LamG-like jellyroll fold domain-containing protein [Bacteroidota bacterium]
MNIGVRNEVKSLTHRGKNLVFSLLDPGSKGYEKSAIWYRVMDVEIEKENTQDQPLSIPTELRLAHAQLVTVAKDTNTFVIGSWTVLSDGEFVYLLRFLKEKESSANYTLYLNRYLLVPGKRLTDNETLSYELSTKKESRYQKSQQKDTPLDGFDTYAPKNLNGEFFVEPVLCLNTVYSKNHWFNALLIPSASERSNWCFMHQNTDNPSDKRIRLYTTKSEENGFPTYASTKSDQFRLYVQDEKTPLLMNTAIQPEMVLFRRQESIAGTEKKGVTGLNLMIAGVAASQNMDNFPYTIDFKIDGQGDLIVPTDNEIILPRINKPAGKALSLNGEGDYLKLTPTKLPEKAKGFTIESWFIYTPISKNGTIPNAGLFSVPVKIQGGMSANIDCYIDSTGEKEKLKVQFEDKIWTSEALLSNKWTLISLVYNSNSKTIEEELSIYLNGSILQTTMENRTNADSTTFISVGQSQRFYFKGVMDEFRVWDIIRTRAMIRSDMFYTLQNESNLIEHLNFSGNFGKRTTLVGDPRLRNESAPVYPKDSFNSFFSFGMGFLNFNDYAKNPVDIKLLNGGDGSIHLYLAMKPSNPEAAPTWGVLQYDTSTSRTKYVDSNGVLHFSQGKAEGINPTSKIDEVIEVKDGDAEGYVTIEFNLDGNSEEYKNVPDHPIAIAQIIDGGASVDPLGANVLSRKVPYYDYDGERDLFPVSTTSKENILSFVSSRMLIWPLGTPFSLEQLTIEEASTDSEHLTLSFDKIKTQIAGEELRCSVRYENLPIDTIPFCQALKYGKAVGQLYEGKLFELATVSGKLYLLTNSGNPGEETLINLNCSPERNESGEIDRVEIKWTISNSNPMQQIIPNTIPALIDTILTSSLSEVVTVLTNQIGIGAICFDNLSTVDVSTKVPLNLMGTLIPPQEDISSDSRVSLPQTINSLIQQAWKINPIDESKSMIRQSTLFRVLPAQRSGKLGKEILLKNAGNFTGWIGDSQEITGHYSTTSTSIIDNLSADSDFIQEGDFTIEFFDKINKQVTDNTIVIKGEKSVTKGGVNVSNPNNFILSNVNLEGKLLETISGIQFTNLPNEGSFSFLTELSNTNSPFTLAYYIYISLRGSSSKKKLERTFDWTYNSQGLRLNAGGVSINNVMPGITLVQIKISVSKGIIKTEVFQPRSKDNKFSIVGTVEAQIGIDGLEYLSFPTSLPIRQFIQSDNDLTNDDFDQLIYKDQVIPKELKAKINTLLLYDVPLNYTNYFSDKPNTINCRVTRAHIEKFINIKKGQDIYSLGIGNKGFGIDLMYLPGGMWHHYALAVSHNKAVSFSKGCYAVAKNSADIIDNQSFSIDGRIKIESTFARGQKVLFLHNRDQNDDATFEIYLTRKPIGNECVVEAFFYIEGDGIINNELIVIRETIKCDVEHYFLLGGSIKNKQSNESTGEFSKQEGPSSTTKDESGSFKFSVNDKTEYDLTYSFNCIPLDSSLDLNEVHFPEEHSKSFYEEIRFLESDGDLSIFQPEGNVDIKVEIGNLRLWSTNVFYNITHLYKVVFPKSNEAKGLEANWDFATESGSVVLNTKGEIRFKLSSPNLWIDSRIATQVAAYIDGEEVPTIPFIKQTVVGEGQNYFKISRSKDEPNAGTRELRYWSVARTSEEIQTDMYQELSGREDHLIGYWPMNEGGNAEYLGDLSSNNNRMKLSDPKQFWENATDLAPLSNETLAIKQILPSNGGSSDFHLKTGIRSIAISEFPQYKRGPGGQLNAAMYRGYVCILNSGAIKYLEDFKVGDLKLDFIGQMQTRPTIIGYIEGAPPVPKENLTRPYFNSPYAYSSYNGISSVTLQESEGESYTFAKGEGQESNFGLNVKYSKGIDAALSKLLAPLGLGIEIDEALEVNLSLERGIGLQLASATSKDTAASTSTKKSRDSYQELVGDWERTELLDDEERYYQPANLGTAIVKSGVADIYAFRIEKTNTYIGTFIIPNDEIRVDYNIIHFPINPTYTKQGTLDGMFKFQPDEDFQKAAVKKGSYFKPQEVYDIEADLDQKRSDLQSNYQSFVSNLNFGENLLSLVTGIPSLFEDVDDVKNQVEPVYSFNEAKQEEKKSEQNDPDEKGTFQRDLINTYVWTANSGLFSEQESISVQREESISNQFQLGIPLSLGLKGGFQFAILEVSLDLNANLGHSLKSTKRKTKSDDRGLEIAVKNNTEGVLNKWNPNKDFGEYPCSADSEPGKVDAYRFKTIYQAPTSKNFNTFFDKVIDPNWLNSSNSNDAIALREARGIPNEAWRVFHRVTYVSRVPPVFNQNPELSVGKAAIPITNIPLNKALIDSILPLKPGELLENKVNTYVDETLKEILQWWEDFKKEASERKFESGVDELKILKSNIISYLQAYLEAEKEEVN